MSLDQSYTVKKSVKADPYIAKTREKINWKGTTGIIKINFPFAKCHIHTKTESGT